MVKDFNIKPIIQKPKSSLQQKNVEVRGTHDFGRMRVPQSAQNVKQEKENVQPIKEPEKEAKKIPDDFYKATKSAKMSADVLLKINTLKPFLKELEEEEKSSSVNEIMDLLINSYVNNRMSSRQRDGFNKMYQNLIELNKIKTTHK